MTNVKEKIIMNDSSKKEIKDIQELCESEKQSITQWRKKRKEDCIPIIFKSSKNEENKDSLIPDLKNDRGSTEERQEIYLAALSEATGASDPNYAMALFAQAVASMPRVEEKMIEYSNMVINTFKALSPKDEIEGMLICQLIALQAQAMEFMSRSVVSTQSTHGVDLNINRSTKLLRLHHETMEALNRYRKKGTQTMIVQHVQVNQGGQAIVGQVQHGGANETK
jgi:hypothetical protein